jgi:hypothetical protein
LTRHRRLAVLAVLILFAVAAVAVFAAARSPWVRGYALYAGYLPVTGRIAGHDADLPPGATVCANCHEPGQPGADPKRLPQLDRRLVESYSRRGGPEAAYTEETFCALLADGVDPTLVLVSRTMPRFTIPREDCAALWAYLSTR